MQLHEGETPVSEDTVRGLLRDQCPAWAVLPLRLLRTSGTEHTIWRLGDGLLVRIPRHTDAESGLVKEVDWWPRLRGVLPIETPEVVHLGSPTPDYPHAWAVNSWLAGEDCATTVLSGAVPSEWADTLAEVILALRAVDLGALPPASLPRGARGGHLRERISGLDEARDWLRTRSEGAAADAVVAAAAAVEPDRQRVLLHADLIPGNLVVRDGRIVGLLDLGTLTTGYPAWDLTCAWWVLDARGRERLRGALELHPDDPSWLWGRAFGLLQGNGARWYYEAKGHPLAALGARAVEQAIAGSMPRVTTDPAGSEHLASSGACPDQRAASGSSDDPSGGPGCRQGSTNPAHSHRHSPRQTTQLLSTRHTHTAGHQPSVAARALALPGTTARHQAPVTTQVAGLGVARTAPTPPTPIVIHPERWRGGLGNR